MENEIRVLAYYNWQKDPTRTDSENWLLAEKQWLDQKAHNCKNKIKVNDLYSNKIFKEAIKEVLKNE